MIDRPFISHFSPQRTDPELLEQIHVQRHELLAESAQKLADRGIELPVFASPTIAGVTLHDTDIIYGVYRERMLEAQQKHLPQFKKSMANEQ